MRYFADTNVFLDAFAAPAFRTRFEVFSISSGAPLVSSIVAAEILFGTVRSAERAAILRELAGTTTALAPTHEDWLTAAMAVSRLELPDAKSRSFWNAALLAAQCARLEVILITSNLADFHRLQREIAVRVVAPFPG